jgi:hypothetical protein
MEERGNYLADRVAGGFMDPSVTVTASDWLKRLSASSKISLRTIEGTPLIQDVKYRKSRLDVKQYLLERDQYRATVGKSPIWTGANIALHHKLLGRSCKVGDRVITQRIGLTKRWQWHSSRSDNCCQACGEIVLGIEHPLRLCRSLDMIESRAHWWNEVERFIAKAPLHLQQDLYTVARHARTSSGGDTACCGTFLPHFVAELPMREDPIGEFEAKIFLKLFKTISAGFRRILRLAAEV